MARMELQRSANRLRRAFKAAGVTEVSDEAYKQNTVYRPWQDIVSPIPLIEYEPPVETGSYKTAEMVSYKARGYL